jgi:hypothetical protein
MTKERTLAEKIRFPHSRGELPTTDLECALIYVALRGLPEGLGDLPGAGDVADSVYKVVIV